MALLDEGDDQFAYALLVLGSVRFDQQRWQEAIAIEQKALVLWDAIGDQRMQAWIYTNLGNAYWWSKDLEQAATHLQAALALFDKVDDPVHRAVAAMNLGGVYIDLNQPQTALIHFEEAEETFRSSQEQLRLAHIYNNIGHAYLALDQPENAVNALVKSLHFWEQLSDHEFWRLNTMTCLGVAHQREGNYEIAADILLQAQSLLPTINLEPQYQVLAREIAEELVLASEGLARTQRGTE